MNSSSKITQQQLEQIDDYLLNRMVFNERSRFEAEIKINPELANAVEAQRQFIRAVELGALKETLRDISKIQSVENETKQESPRYWFAMAASFLALVALGLWIYLKPDINDRVFAEYAEADPGLPVPMSAVNEYHFYDAMVDYKNEKYSEAIQKWSALASSNPVNDSLNYYLAAAHFNLGNYHSAIKLYEEVINSKSLEFSAKSQWYLVLSWIKTKEIDKIRATADTVSGVYASKIQEIDNALKAHREN